MTYLIAIVMMPLALVVSAVAALFTLVVIGPLMLAASVQEWWRGERRGDLK